MRIAFVLPPNVGGQLRGGRGLLLGVPAHARFAGNAAGLCV